MATTTASASTAMGTDFHYEGYDPRLPAFGIGDTTFQQMPWCDLHCRGSALGMIFILIFLLGAFFWFIVDCYIIHAPRFHHIVLDGETIAADRRLIGINTRAGTPKTWYQCCLHWLPGISQPLNVRATHPLVADPEKFGTPIEKVLDSRYGANVSQGGERKPPLAFLSPPSVNYMGPIPGRESSTTGSRMPSSHGYYPRN
jgi:hypothetical protein